MMETKDDRRKRDARAASDAQALTMAQRLCEAKGWQVRMALAAPELVRIAGGTDPSRPVFPYFAVPETGAGLEAAMLFVGELFGAIRAHGLEVAFHDDAAWVRFQTDRATNEWTPESTGDTIVVAALGAAIAAAGSAA